MTVPPATSPPRQIIIAAGCYADATSAIPMAARLARWAGADLHGILVEQDEALTTVGLFSARLITPSGAQIAAPTVPQMRRSLATDARTFEAELARLSKANQRGWTFERLQGGLVAQMRAAAKKADILFVGHQGFYRQLGAVILIHTPGQAQRRTFDVAVELARNQNAPLFIWAAATDPEQRHLASVELKDMLRRANVPGSVARTFCSTGEILDRINRSSASAVVVDAQTDLFHSDSDMGLLLDAARSTLVVVGSADDARSKGTSQG